MCQHTSSYDVCMHTLYALACVRQRQHTSSYDVRMRTSYDVRMRTSHAYVIRYAYARASIVVDDCSALFVYLIRCACVRHTLRIRTQRHSSRWLFCLVREAASVVPKLQKKYAALLHTWLMYLLIRTRIYSGSGAANNLHSLTSYITDALLAFLDTNPHLQCVRRRKQGALRAKVFEGGAQKCWCVICI